ncbi:MAG: hypothetical protein ACI8RZ_002293 [Myxococcota bacterium]|jgi:hypothetical protein
MAPTLSALSDSEEGGPFGVDSHEAAQPRGKQCR